ncbi:MAG: CinA family nicotinamide mononucleotide deamidase-related protein [Acidobacteriota bacterium]
MTGPRRAAFVAVGSELLRAGRLDTNSLLVARLLQECGYALVEKRCVEDDAEAIGRALRELTPRAELVVFSGGLGPTADDVTREGVAAALGLGIIRLEAIEKALLSRFQSAGRAMPAITARMADVIEGAEVLPNPKGTAPGQLLQVGDSVVVLLPGVPRELEEIFRTNLLRRWECTQQIHVRVLHLGGVYESGVEERVSPLYERFGRDSVTILAQRGQVDLVLTAAGEHGAARLAEMENAFAAATGRDLFGRDGETLPEVVLAHARRRGWLLATAESCTGGLVGARLTSVTGASEVYVGGVVAYANALKQGVLEVRPETLERYGAVSRECAEEMARGACRLGADCSLAITGIAGPAGGSPEKPVGTVHMAVATPSSVRHLATRFPGDREMVRALAATFALDLLRRVLDESGDPGAGGTLR